MVKGLDGGGIQVGTDSLCARLDSLEFAEISWPKNWLKSQYRELWIVQKLSAGDREVAECGKLMKNRGAVVEKCV